MNASAHHSLYTLHISIHCDHADRGELLTGNRYRTYDGRRLDVKPYTCRVCLQALVDIPVSTGVVAGRAQHTRCYPTGKRQRDDDVTLGQAGAIATDLSSFVVDVVLLVLLVLALLVVGGLIGLSRRERLRLVASTAVRIQDLCGRGH